MTEGRKTSVRCLHCYDSGKWYSVTGPDRRVEWHVCALCHPDEQ